MVTYRNTMADIFVREMGRGRKDGGNEDERGE